MKDNHRRGKRRTCLSSTKVTAGLLLSFLAVSNTVAALQLPPIGPLDPQAPLNADTSHTFTLRHIFHRGTYQDPRLHKRLDIAPNSDVLVTFEDETPYTAPPPRLRARSESLQIERLADRSLETIDRHLSYAGRTGSPVVLDASEWLMDKIDGPNVTDKETVINLAIMAADAYVPMINEGEWENVTNTYNESTSFGWQGDGLRGHIFADEGNRTIVIGLKGTSPAVFDGDGTTTRDKLNDNLFFSCCCGQGGQFFWRQVCDCQSGTYSCNATCVTQALKQKTRYYSAAIDLYTNVTALYPDSNIWIVGHSLGGAVSSLLGLTFGLPVVTFEAPGDDLAARRLGLPAPPTSNPYHPHQRSYTGSRHFGHTADPVFMGTCNGATSTCTLGGYAMESQCHSGLQCVYDTVGDLSWRVGIGYHKIHNVIDNVIKKYDKVPECVSDSECVDCFNWKYFESNGSTTTTTTTKHSTTTSMTRTETCKTPGWWGCLDESTSKGPTSTTNIVTTTYTTTSCIQPGWFGCNKEANVTITTTTVPPTSKSKAASTTRSTTCDPGWFGLGCDETSAITVSTHSTVSQTTGHNTCETPGLFFGCRDRHSKSRDTFTATITPPPKNSVTATASSTSSSSKTSKHKKCKNRAFFGLICLDPPDDDGSGRNSESRHFNTEL